MAANAAFKIYFPQSVSITSPNCQIVYNLVSYTPNVCVVDPTNMVITISGNFPVAVPAGGSITFNFGPVINPQTTNKQVLGTFGI